MSEDSAFFEFAADQFPIWVRCYRDDEMVWEALVPDPGALNVPALGSISRCVVELADGTVMDTANRT